MAHLRPIERRMLEASAILAVAAGVAAPALAAGPAPDRAEPSEAGPETPTAVASVSRDVRRAGPKLAAHGHYVPVVGGVDYGTAQNAYGAARSGHMHAGHDLFAPAGRPLVAVSDGVIVDAGTDGGQGNYVHLYEPDRDRTYVYMHMVAPSSAATGDRVRAGEELGAVGCTGSCWGDHLHFEVREGRGFGGDPRDPLPLLREWPALKNPLDG